MGGRAGWLANGVILLYQFLAFFLILHQNASVNTMHSINQQQFPGKQQRPFVASSAPVKIHHLHF